MASLRDQAVRLARLGYRVFPLQPGGKIPEIAHADWQTVATNDPVKVREMWTGAVVENEQPFNIGIALDPNTVVVDVDVRDGKKGVESLRLLEMLYDPLPGTYTVRTASGGRHHYYRGTGPFGAHLAEHVDLKSAGGYVVAEGSVIGGRRYTAMIGEAGDLAELPKDYLALARQNPRTLSTGHKGEAAALVDLDQPEALRRATEWLRTRAPDHGTFKVAARVKDFGISAEMCKQLLGEHWADEKGLDKGPEHIAERVDNAYRYGQSAPGVRSAEAEFEAVEIAPTVSAPKKRGRLFYERWRDTQPDADAPHLIRDWYDLGAMVVTYGESGAGKTHVVLNQAFAIASGRPWAGTHAVRPGLVVYVAAEGGRGMRSRIAAYRAHHGEGSGDLPFALVPCPVDLLRPSGDTKALIALIKEAQADFGQPCVMVVLDTLSRVLAGGNENGPDDMGALVMHCDRIREATGATLHLIHHSGKDVAKGARGHSLLRAATDTEIEVGGGTVKATKQRDMETARELSFRLEKVPPSVVCRVERANEFEMRLSGRQEEMLAVLTRLAGFRDDGLVGSRSWKTALGMVSGDRTADKTFERDVTALVQTGHIDVVSAPRKESEYRVLSEIQATS